MAKTEGLDKVITAKKAYDKAVVDEKKADEAYKLARQTRAYAEKAYFDALEEAKKLVVVETDV